LGEKRASYTFYISWDKDLLAIEEFKGIKIVNPGEFLEIYER
jgi:predicted nucleic acid-binding protein